MYFVYYLLLPIVAVLLSPLIVAAFIIQPKFRAGFWEKIGFYKANNRIDNNKKTVVFHAVSVGETNAIETFVKKYREQNPNVNIVLTTTTKTGQEVAVKKIGSVVNQITYFPYDFYFSVNAFFSCFRPETVVIAETEIWPCFVKNAKNRNIKVVIANGRISPNSYNGYMKFSFIFKNILSNYNKILMQSEDDAKRIIDIGANVDLVKVMGNLKYDISPTLSQQEVTSLALELGLNGERVFVAASTHSGEDEIVVDAYLTAKKSHSDLKMIIAPRHPQRYDEVIEIIQKTGMRYGRRSTSDKFSDVDIIMLDTMGELSNFFSIAHIAFIGGSFSNTGGHNPLEANIYGKPVLSGPTIFNFKDVYKLLTPTGAAIIVNTREELASQLIISLEDSSKYQLASSAASQVFERNRGAVDFLINELE